MCYMHAWSNLIIRAFLWCSARCWSWSRKRQTEEAPGDWIICTGKGERGQTNRRAVERDRSHRFRHIPIAIISLRIEDGAQVSRDHLRLGNFRKIDRVIHMRCECGRHEQNWAQGRIESVVEERRVGVSKESGRWR